MPDPEQFLRSYQETDSPEQSVIVNAVMTTLADLKTSPIEEVRESAKYTQLLMETGVLGITPYDRLRHNFPVSTTLYNTSKSNKFYRSIAIYTPAITTFLGKNHFLPHIENRLEAELSNTVFVIKQMFDYPYTLDHPFMKSYAQVCLEALHCQRAHLTAREQQGRNYNGIFYYGDPRENSDIEELNRRIEEQLRLNDCSFENIRQAAEEMDESNLDPFQKGRLHDILSAYPREDTLRSFAWTRTFESQERYKGILEKLKATQRVSILRKIYLQLGEVELLKELNEHRRDIPYIPNEIDKLLNERIKDGFLKLSMEERAKLSADYILKNKLLGVLDI